MTLSARQIEKIKEHLTDYGLGSLSALPDSTFESGTLYSLVTNFLTIENCTIHYQVVKNNETDFLFFIRAITGDNEFSGFFPQMQPFSPWGISLADEHPFPDLTFVTVDTIEWSYVYFSTVDEAIQKNLYEKAKIETPGLDKLKNINRKLKNINRENELPAGNSGWQGGLYYTGNFNIPLDQLSHFGITQEISGKTSIPVQGGIFHHQMSPCVKLQIPLVSLHGNLIKKADLSIDVSSHLLAAGSSPDAKGRGIGLLGKIQVNDNVDINARGYWPMDSDEFVITATCKLSNINDCFNSNSITNISLPRNAEAGLMFSISKEFKTLQTLSFALALDTWDLLSGKLRLGNVNFGVKVMSPGSLNVVMADFIAKATIGETVGVICKGRYPDSELYIGLDPDTPIKLNDIIKVFHSPGLQFAEGLVITELWGTYRTVENHFSLKLRVAQESPLAISDATFQLNDISLQIYGASTYRFKLQAVFTYKFKKSGIAPMLLSGSAEYNDGWAFYAACNGDFTLRDLAEEFGFSKVPDELHNFRFVQLSFGLISGNDSRKFFSGTCKITLLGTEVDLSLQVVKSADTTSFAGNFSTLIGDKDARFSALFISENTGYKLNLQLLFTVAGITIALDAAKSSSEDSSQKKISDLRFSGSAQGLKISVSDLLDDLVGKILPDYKNKLHGLLPSIDLTDIYVTYDGASKQTNVMAVASVAGKELRLFFQRNSGEENSSYIFGISTDVDSLEKLPLVGGEMKEVSLRGVGFVYTSDEGNYILPELSPPAKTDDKQLTFPAKGTNYEKGFNLTGKLQLPVGNNIPLALTPKESPAPLSDKQNAPVQPVLLASAAPSERWINLNKKIGPVSVSKIGLGFQDGYLSLLLSGAVNMAGLTLTLEGLGLSFGLSKLINGHGFDGQFRLSGLGIAFEKNPLKISGMFMRVTPKAGETISFYGAAQITTSQFSISGVGAYSRLTNNADSLFVYAIFNGPIGGPACFFVTGIAAGFGYNRTLRTPKLEEVSKYPLVAMALSDSTSKKSMNEVLADLVKEPAWIPSSPGDYWMAVGIKFTSFKIIDSFVLLTVQFGTKLQFTIAGLSLLKWPEKNNPIINIELAILARFGPDSDVIAVDGMLTPNCYLFDKNCKLSGGFAFYAWVAGKHEGDFVISLGGYHPKYPVPHYYPKVERLRLDWQLSSVLQMRGEMYFALTPKAIMAGGRWEINYNLSFLKATAIYWANLIMYWAPFHYEADGGVIVRIEADIKILFVSIHFSIQMSCTLQIWGPPFSGTIQVDWTIFSFTIPFGSSRKNTPPALAWSSGAGLLKSSAGKDSASAGFLESFVPKKENKLHPLDVRILGGVSDEARNNDGSKVVFVNPYDLVLGVDSFFPVSTIHALEAAHECSNHNRLPDGTLMHIAGMDAPQLLAKRNMKFGIKPMGISDATVQLSVWIESVEAHANQNIRFDFITTAKGITGALWANAGDEASVIKEVLTGLRLHTKNANDDAVPLVIDTRTGYDNKSQSTAVDYLRGTDNVRGHENIQDILHALEKEMAKADVEAALRSLDGLGFELYHPDKLSYNDLEIEAPFFLVSLGEKLPAKIIS